MSRKTLHAALAVVTLAFAAMATTVATAADAPPRYRIVPMKGQGELRPHVAAVDLNNAGVALAYAGLEGNSGVYAGIRYRRGAVELIEGSQQNLMRDINDAGDVMAAGPIIFWHDGRYEEIPGLLKAGRINNLGIVAGTVWPANNQHPATADHGVNNDGDLVGNGYYQGHKKSSIAKRVKP